ncbi:hypothetical protein RCOM_0610210 [Ricinus communis]|uniref:TF-B3 domain-containing protein n=1 Tax=Ricinus communis TaxID=3988 RepID=B9S7N8_RICCO|nr:hypothetical protein RCOM_0610210 [Ricinus communis]
MPDQETPSPTRSNQLEDDKDWFPLVVALMDFQSLAAIREGAKNNNIVGTSIGSLSALTPKQKTESLSALTSKKKRGCEKKVVEEPKSLHPHVKIFGSIFQQGGKEEKVNTKRARTCFKSEEKSCQTVTNIPYELRRKIETKGGTNVKLVMTKKLFKTDLSSGHNRLSMPLNQIKDHTFLQEEERQKLEKYDELSVQFMEPCGVDSVVKVKKWAYRNQKGSSYALRTGWNDVVARNQTTEEEIKEFKENDMIQIWSFRVEGVLWLTLYKAREALNDNNANDVHKGDGDGASTSHNAAVD